MSILDAAANSIQWLEAERDELSQLAAQANKRIEQLESENAELRKQLGKPAEDNPDDYVMQY
jgi:cell shape-determining protein MreC